MVCERQMITIMMMKASLYEMVLIICRRIMRSFIHLSGLSRLESPSIARVCEVLCPAVDINER